MIIFHGIPHFICTNSHPLAPSWSKCCSNANASRPNGTFCSYAFEDQRKCWQRLDLRPQDIPTRLEPLLAAE